MPLRMALGLVMIAALGTAGGIGSYAVSNGGMGDAMKANPEAQCGSMTAECSQDHANRAKDMADGTVTGCTSMGMTTEQCQTMHDGSPAGMMPGGMHSEACH